MGRNLAVQRLMLRRRMLCRMRDSTGSQRRARWVGKLWSNLEKTKAEAGSSDSVNSMAYILLDCDSEFLGAVCKLLFSLLGFLDLVLKVSQIQVLILSSPNFTTMKVSRKAVST